MKQIKTTASLLLLFLFSCQNNGNIEVPEDIVPVIYLEYIDKEGNRIINETDHLFGIENPLEVLSITDENDKPIQIGKSRVFNTSTVCFGISEIFSFESPKVERIYSVKFKFPYILEESVEELKLIFSVNGLDSKFTNAWHNSIKIDRFVTEEMFFPQNTITPIHADDLDAITAYEKRKKELLYNGNTVAFIEGSNINLIIPINK
jgi:hypothetical protein